MAEREAVEPTVTGNDQQVAFRAVVMKQAIEYNLAGSARNDANEIVHFALQGDKPRIDLALATLQEGTKRSSDIKIATTSAVIDREHAKPWGPSRCDQRGTFVVVCLERGI